MRVAEDCLTTDNWYCSDMRPDMVTLEQLLANRLFLVLVHIVVVTDLVVAFHFHPQHLHPAAHQLLILENSTFKVEFSW